MMEDVVCPHLYYSLSEVVMKSYKLAGVDVLNRPVNLAKDVSYFTNSSNYFKVFIKSSSTVEVVTPKGVYVLAKHPTLNIYSGKCADHKVHVSLKKIVGKVIYW
jgi:hypothetical protein